MQPIDFNAAKTDIAQLVVSTYSLSKPASPEDQDELLGLVQPALMDIAAILVQLPLEDFEATLQMVQDSFSGKHSPLSVRGADGNLDMHPEGRIRLAEAIMEKGGREKFFIARDVLERTTAPVGTENS